MRLFKAAGLQSHKDNPLLHIQRAERLVKYRLIAVDMDGTLLNSRNQVSRRTVLALREASRRGVIVIIATGRPVQGIESCATLLEIELPLIAYNGGMIFEKYNTEAIFESCLTKKSAKRVIDFGMEHNSSICVWSNHMLYVFEINENVNRYAERFGIAPIEILDKNLLINQGITKILWSLDNKAVHSFERQLKEYFDEELAICVTGLNYLEVFDRNVSKGNALEFLGNHFGILPSEMIAIGDSYNDASMIEYAGLGVSMRNSPKELKSISNYITESNDNHGVAVAVEKFVL